MDWLNGKKTYLVALAVALITGLNYAGIIDQDVTDKAYGILAALGLYTVRSGIAKAAPIVLALLAFGLGSPSPSHAGTDPSIPPIGCGGGACNFYLVSGGWSPHSKQVFVGGNAVDFLSGSFGVGLFGVAADGDMNFIGGVCAIPKVKDALAFICPPPTVP